MLLSSVDYGIDNLLLNYSDLKSGDRLLIATEAPELGFLDPRVTELIVDRATRLGIIARVVDVGFAPHDPRLPKDIRAQIADWDAVLFIARLGMQLRFAEMPENARIVVSFAHREELLASRFSTIDVETLQLMKTLVDDALAGAQEVRITCPAGTDIVGRPQIDRSVDGDTTVRRFPLSVFTPVPGKGFSGRVALRFLAGTGAHYYPGTFLEFDTPVFARMQDGRLCGFEGDGRDVARAEAQYDRVAALYGTDRDCIHSWHAGIHPGNGFYWDIHDNDDRWSEAAFGNPRILHFHTCGATAPGEICWNVFDPTVAIDGVAVWDRGTLHPDRLPGAADAFARHPDLGAVMADMDRAIGVALPWDSAA